MTGNLKVTIMRENNLDFLKSLALLTMAIDHCKYIFNDYWQFFYIIGRFAFIGFAFITAVHCIRFFNKENKSGIYSGRRYIKNLIIFFLISEIPYQLLAHGSIGLSGDLNIFLTLLLGVAGCYIINKTIHYYVIFVLLLIILNPFIQYGGLGVILVISFYQLLQNNQKGLLLITSSISTYATLQFTQDFVLLNIVISISCIASTFLCYCIYTSKIKLPNFLKVGKWAWWFYPVHLLVYYLISLTHNI